MYGPAPYVAFDRFEAARPAGLMMLPPRLFGVSRSVMIGFGVLEEIRTSPVPFAAADSGLNEPALGPVAFFAK